MKKLFSLLLIVLTANLFSQSKVASVKTKVENVDAATFKKYMDVKNAYIIDLRTTAEIESKGKIKGSEQIDFLAKNSEEAIGILDKKRTYMIYCAGGGRSGDCVELMTKLGFKYVINLEKGFDDWKKQGYETVMPGK